MCSDQASFARVKLLDRPISIRLGNYRIIEDVNGTNPILVKYDLRLFEMPHRTNGYIPLRFAFGPVISLLGVYNDN